MYELSVSYASQKSEKLGNYAKISFMGWINIWLKIIGATVLNTNAQITTLQLKNVRLQILNHLGLLTLLQIQ